MQDRISVTAQLMIVLLPAAGEKAHSGPRRVFWVGAQKEDVRAQAAQPVIRLRLRDQTWLCHGFVDTHRHLSSSVKMMVMALPSLVRCFETSSQ